MTNRFTYEQGQYTGFDYEAEQNELDATQNYYRHIGKYVPYTNKVEERLAESVVAERLATLLSGWTILPLYNGVGKVDVLAISPKAHATFIEVKSKSETPEMYVKKYTGEVAVDRLTTFSHHTLTSALHNANYIVCVAVSEYLPANNVESSAMTLGVVDTQQVSIDECEKVLSTAYTGQYAYRIPYNHPSVIYKGKDALQQLAQRLLEEEEKR